MKRSRILIKNIKIRKLFWIGEEKDRSIYIGSYLPITKYKTGSFVKLPKNKVHVSYSDGQFVHLDRNTKIKISFHPSGQTHAKTQDKYREQIWMEEYDELYKIQECKELGFLLPKKLEDYPIMEKPPSESDVILPTNQFDDKPFVVVLYLTEKSFDPKRLLTPKKGCCVLCVFKGSIVNLILLAYQTEDSKLKGSFPPNEYWVTKRND